MMLVDRAVQFAHEMARRIHLVLRRQLGTFGQRSVENRGVRTRDEQPGRIAFAVVLNFPARRVGRVLRIAACAQSGLVQQGAAIQVQDEYRRIGSRVVDFFECRHPAFRKLELGPTADNPHPLTGRRALRLFFEHAESVGERRHAIPTQLHVIVQPSANDVEV